ncbi:MAG: ComEC family competence protein [Rhodobacteraceae bacterium]|nr:ComEC family competence protein [Paracoccaceae bacterium]
MFLAAAFDTGAQALQRQRGHLITFAPVFLAIGIGAYFSADTEPARALYGVAIAVLFGAAGAAHVFRHTLGPAFAALALVALGFALAGVRAHTLGGPIIDFRYYGGIEGRVVAIDRSASDKVRLTLDRVRLDRMEPWETPTRVRVSLHAQEGMPVPLPGSHAMVTGFLSAPPSPAEPHGFDFERHAWFQELGAVGYARSPAVTFSPPESGAALFIFRNRMALSAAIQARIPGDAGAVAAAVTTGDRSGMDEDVVLSLRRSNLAHLLAISGLHMGLLTGFVFGLVRFALVLHPTVALTWPTRKIAAAAALVAGAGYLALSGGAVATERAFIMAAVVFGAVIVGRRALTLRAVALAALIVLALQPEALLGPGFQMSFAATTALVVTFRWLSSNDMMGLPRWLRPWASLVISSAIAGAATAPFAAAHFNIVSYYGLVANLLSVPIMGAIVMPAAVLAVVLAPLGLSFIPLWLMEQGLKWILCVAQEVSSLEGAVGRVSAPGPETLPLITLGALLIILWRGRERWVGLAPVALAFGLWAIAERPALLISPTGGLVGLMEAGERHLSKEKGDGFVARSWLENDADDADQSTAFQRGDGPRMTLGDHQFLHLTGKRAREASCAGAVILVLNDEPEGTLQCEAITPSSLRETGAIAFTLQNAALQKLTAREVTGRRLWNDRDVRARYP